MVRLMSTDRQVNTETRDPCMTTQGSTPPEDTGADRNMYVYLMTPLKIQLADTDRVKRRDKQISKYRWGF